MIFLLFNWFQMIFDVDSLITNDCWFGFVGTYVNIDFENVSKSMGLFSWIFWIMLAMVSFCSFDKSGKAFNASKTASWFISFKLINPFWLKRFLFFSSFWILMDRSRSMSSLSNSLISMLVSLKSSSSHCSTMSEK